MTPLSQLNGPVALVLCGGSSRGALEVGFYKAITELGIPIDFVIGSSIGALNGAYIAAGMPPAELAGLWRGFRRGDAVQVNLVRWLSAPGKFPGLYNLDPMRKFLNRTLPVRRFEQLPVPLIVTATSLQEGEAVYWQGEGDMIEPLIASMSLPGVFPPVVIGGRQFVDGSVANNVPLDKAVELGARTTLTILCVCCDQESTRFSGLVNVLARSFSIAFNCRFNPDIARFQDAARIHVVRPRFPKEVSLLEFRHSGALIETAYRQTMMYFAGNLEPDRPALSSPAAGSDASIQPVAPARGVS